jgi:hypothetical protein
MVKASVLMKVSVLLTFIVLTGSYVAYRVGAFSKYFPDNKKVKVKTEKKEPNGIDSEELMVGSKSAPFIKSKMVKSKNEPIQAENLKMRADKEKKELMVGPNSAEVFEIEPQEEIEDKIKAYNEKPQINLPLKNFKKDNQKK